MVSRLKERISFLAPVYIYPDEDELEALAQNVLGTLRGELSIAEYNDTGWGYREQICLIVIIV